MTTGKDQDNDKDNDSKDNGNDCKDNNNDRGNGNSGGGGFSAGGGKCNVRFVAVLCHALVVLRLHTVGIIQICVGILFWSKFYLACPDMLNKILAISYLDQV